MLSHTITRRLLIKSSIALFTVIFLAHAGSVKPEEVGPVVVANGEELHGAWEATDKSIAVFKAIPFAAPPVGELRWRAPVANQPRPGPQQAIEFAPGCMQTPYITDWYASVAKRFGHGPEAVGRPNGVSEDCLYLNIWSPDPDPGASLPVMVWVHGGSNKGGWSYEPNYIGAKLAAKGVIVVTISYRLGAFGFFSHPLLNNDDGEPVANFGWLDSIQAFRWVAQNIQVFGGDPGNVTAIGESSGAGDISDWIATDIVEDRLYRRSILQSSAGSLVPRRTLADEQKVGSRLIDSIGLKGQPSVERLRQIPAVEILAAAEAELAGHYFDVVIDELTLRLTPLASLHDKTEFAVEVLIGTNADEWYMYVDESADRADLEHSITQIAPQNSASLLALVEQETDVRRAMDRIMTASDTLCPSRYLASTVTSLGGRGWVYYFSRQRPGPGGDKLGAYHGTEIPYVFDTHDEWLPTEAIDRELTEVIMDYWVQFARVGDPNLPNRPEWPVHSQSDPRVMELGDNIGAIEPPDVLICDLLGLAR